MENYYKILGINKNASSEEIKKAYLSELKKYHPDIYKEDPEFAETKTAELNKIYQTLKNEETKKEYDIKLFGKSKVNDYGIFGDLARRIKENFKQEPKTKYKAQQTIKKTKLKSNNKQETKKIKRIVLFDDAEKKEKFRLYLSIAIILSILVAIILICLLA